MLEPDIQVDHFQAGATMPLNAGWDCLVCGLPPKSGQFFAAVVFSPDESKTLFVQIHHEFITDCGY